jgi:hypothetical protein
MRLLIATGLGCAVLAAQPFPRGHTGFSAPRGSYKPVPGTFRVRSGEFRVQPHTFTVANATFTPSRGYVPRNVYKVHQRTYRIHDNQMAPQGEIRIPRATFYKGRGFVR